MKTGVTSEFSKSKKVRQRILGYAHFVLALFATAGTWLLVEGAFVGRAGATDSVLEFAQVIQRAPDSRSVRNTVRGLPSDEWMLNHFRENRDNLESLVHLYQTENLRISKTIGNSVQPIETEQYKNLKKRALVFHLANDGAIWLPDPYSKNSGEMVRKMDLIKSYKYHGVIVRLEPSISYASSSEIGRTVWKSFYFVPIVPRVEGGWLLWPVDERGQIFRRKRVVGNLDEFPLNWFREPPPDLPELAGCVYRNIEPQWFITLCNGR